MVMRKQQILCVVLLLVICLSGCTGDKEQMASEAVSSEENIADVQEESDSVVGENSNVEAVTQQSDEQ